MIRRIFIQALLFLYAANSILLMDPGALWAEASPLNLILGHARAVVSLQSINATVLSGQPQAAYDKNTGVLYLMNRIYPMAYERSGSGVIIDPKGLIVAAAHTVTNAGAVAVTLFDGTRVPCKKILMVPNTDIAFLTIDPPFPLVAVPLADPKTIVPGGSVYAFGNSQWIKGSLLGGKLIGVKRDNLNGTAHATWLQVSFSMYQGDSGSPLFDSRGELLGIVSAGKEGRDNATFGISSDVIQEAWRSYAAAFFKKAESASKVGGK